MLLTNPTIPITEKAAPGRNDLIKIFVTKPSLGLRMIAAYLLNIKCELSAALQCNHESKKYGKITK